MFSTSIKYCKKYVSSCKDSSDKKNQLGFYARDAHESLIFAKEFNSFIHEHKSCVISIHQKF